MIADHYIDNHLKGEPNGCYSNKMKRDLALEMISDVYFPALLKEYLKNKPNEYGIKHSIKIRMSEI